MTAPRRSPLDAVHRCLGAHMTCFGGWEMPLDYGSVVAEHRAVRASCGVFDLTHLGTLRVRSLDAVQRAFTNDAAALPVGRAHYTLCLDERGGIVDDLLVYHLDWGYFVVPNAANTAAVVAAIGVDVEDVKDQLACVAVQGPASPAVAAAAGLDVDGMDYLDVRRLSADGVLARSGYTGERGYEAFVPAETASELWRRVVEAGAVPAGLGARDTLRLEMGYPLHGNDISPATSPVEARLTWAVKENTEFRGRDAYVAIKESSPPARRLWGLRALGRGIPRAGCTVWREAVAVGEVTSGTFSPTLGSGIALAYLAADVEPGAHVEIDVRGKRVPAEVTRPPFVTSNPRT